MEEKQKKSKNMTNDKYKGLKKESLIITLKNTKTGEITTIKR
jgi:stress response protein YsnF